MPVRSAAQKLFVTMRQYVRGVTRAQVILFSIGIWGIVLTAAPRVDFVDIAVGAGQGDVTAAWEKTRVAQTFRPRRGGLKEITMRVATPTHLETPIAFFIRPAETDRLLFATHGPLREFLSPDQTTLRFSFRPIAGTGDRLLVFEITAPNLREHEALGLRYETAGYYYPDGERLVNGHPKPGDLGFTATVQEGFWRSWARRVHEGRAGQWFLGLGVVTLGALLLLDRPWTAPARRRQWLYRVTLASFVFAFLAVLPFFGYLGRWAADEGDWPELVSHLAAARQTIALREFPGWNPYLCGGTPAFTNPQTYFLSLHLPAALVFGDIVGPKIVTPLIIAAGLLGMTLLADALGLRGLAAVLPGPLFLLSGFFTTHFANGQFLWLTLAWVPWVILGFIRATRQTLWWAALSAAGLTLTFIEGRVYLVAYLALLLFVLAVAESLRDRSLRPLASLIAIGILTVGFSAWKLVPTLTFLADSATSLPNTDGVPLAALDEAFLRRDVTPGVEDSYGDRTLPRREYAAYLGLLPLLLAGLAWNRRTRHDAIPLFATALTFTVLAMQRSGTSLLEYLPLARELRNPSRLLSMSVFSISLLSGFGLTVVQRIAEQTSLPRLARTLLPGVLCAVIATDLLLVAQTPLSRLFTADPRPHTFDAPEFFQTKEPSERQATNGYATVTAGKGARDFCPVVLRAYQPQHKVRAREDQNYKGEVYAERGSAVTLLRSTPNTLIMRVRASVPDRIIVNQQYARGWTADPFRAHAHETLLATEVPAGEHVVTFRYHIPKIGLGSTLTAFTITFLIGLALLTRVPRIR